MKTKKGEPVGPPRQGDNGSKREPTKSKSQLQDDSIMGTNNSSIVSKRSVERLYFPNEPHFFRYFVKKPQRRSPLINRGYWLRMKAIDEVVKQFLEQSSEKRKIVINLGCGYDPLPWQCFTRYRACCTNTTFIDIDYRDLMLRKRTVVQSTPELNSMLSHVESPEGDVLFKSDQYIQLGCDLRNLSALGDTLSSVVDIQNCLVLLTAEVSITYMDVKGADALIEWASKIPDARFCLLEQILPEGIEHPFAKTMMAHFDKIGTSINAVQKYPTAISQQRRFSTLGWSKVDIQILWQLWSSPDFLGPSERQALDQVEPFDEWEEFALFGCHYFLLVASTEASSLPPYFKAHKHQEEQENQIRTGNQGADIKFDVEYTPYPKGQGQRRFAAAMPLKGPNKLPRFGVFGGVGTVSRTNSYDEYAADTLQLTQPKLPKVSPSSRMCHTITDLGGTGALLVGGRTSPDNGFKDCWLYQRWLEVWERVDDLPYPLYRHQAVRIGSDHVLVSTGRINSQNISPEMLIWSRFNGWTKCRAKEGDKPCPTYGHLFLASTSDASDGSKYGIISGGITEFGIIQSEIWRWRLHNYDSLEPIIEFKTISIPGELISRFGGEAINWNDNHALILGGIAKDRLLTASENICAINLTECSIDISQVQIQGLATSQSLMLGSSAVVVDNKLIITGGSCVCFSFGSWWNDGSLTLSPPKAQTTGIQDSNSGAWRYLRTVEAEAAASIKIETNASLARQSLVGLPRIQVKSSSEFMDILKSSKPVILENLYIGECTSKWTNEYLKGKVGDDRDIVVHQSLTNNMDFKAKNFTYTSMKFGEFLNRIQAGKTLYLRSLSSVNPAELPTQLSIDFPSLANDFQLPPALEFVRENTHSSPLRISGPVNMWLHFDVMANVLCQIQGSKRVLLFPPLDALKLDFTPGSSSSSINVFERLEKGTLENCHPHDAVLNPGDVLFIPPLWLHAASPTSTISVGVNVFFRNLIDAYATGRDTYGNRDLKAYEKGRLDIAKIVKSFDGLPTDVRAFYLKRLADEFTRKAT